MWTNLPWSDEHGLDIDTQVGPLAALERGFQLQKSGKFKNALGCRSVVDYIFSVRPQV